MGPRPGPMLTAVISACWWEELRADEEADERSQVEEEIVACRDVRHEGRAKGRVVRDERRDHHACCRHEVREIEREK